jgi:integrase
MVVWLERGKGVYRLRYWVNGKRISTTFRGSRSEAQRAFRDLLHACDTGEHVPPDNMTVGQWIDQWLGIGAPGKRRKKPSPRTVERYSQFLRTHVVPALGRCRLQKLTGPQIDNLYMELTPKIAPRTAHSVHVTLGAALGAAVRAGGLSASPMTRVLKIPSPGEANHGIALGEDDLHRLVNGFRTSPLFLIVAVAAYTGMRRNEVLALRWTDLSATEKTLRVERPIEQTKGHIGFKQPKTKRGTRSIVIDDNLLELLRREREKYLRLVAGIPDGSSVDLSLMRLPDEALMFPSPSGAWIDLIQPRDPHAVARGFVKRARKLGFAGLRFHDLRGSHGSNLLRRGVPVDVVARRLGHDPVTLWRSYVKALPQDDAITLDALRAMSNGNHGDREQS